MLCEEYKKEGAILFREEPKTRRRNRKTKLPITKKQNYCLFTLQDKKYKQLVNSIADWQIIAIACSKTLHNSYTISMIPYSLFPLRTKKYLWKKC